MRLYCAVLCTSIEASSPVFAEGDIDAGESVFKKCKSCQMITTDDGTAVQKGGKTGPNLFGVIGRVAGSVKDFKYGKSLIAAGEAGKIRRSS